MVAVGVVVGVGVGVAVVVVVVVVVVVGVGVGVGVNMSGYWHSIEAEAFGYESEWADISVREYREPKPARFAGENLKAVNDAWEFRRVYLHQWLIEQWEGARNE